MLPSEHRSQGKNRPYANDPFKKLSIQDALILVSVWAAVLDENNLQKKAKHIADLAKKEKLFEESDKVMLGRVHKCLNNMKHKKDQDSEIILASRSLPQKYRKLAFSWATDVMAMADDVTEDTLKPLYELYYKLGIEAKCAQDIIKKQLSRTKHL